MFQISLYVVGLVLALFFTLASNVLNYVSIASSNWTSDVLTNLFRGCSYPPIANNAPLRPSCFTTAPPVLIGIGTAFNFLSLLLMVISSISICWIRFRNSYAMYFVMVGLLTTLLSLVLSTTGWYLVIDPVHQQLGGAGGTAGLTPGFKFDWSFWLMAPSFGCSVIAALIISNLIGCTCTTNGLTKQSKKEYLPTTKPASYRVTPASPQDDSLRF